MARSLDPKKDRENERHRQWIEGLLVSAQKRGWFGSITIHIKQGQVDRVVNEESLKPPISGE